MNMTIDQIVRRTIMEMGYTIHQYPFFYNLAIHGLQEMEIDTLGTIREVKLPQASASLDFKLGMFVGVRYLNGGHFIAVPENDSLSLERLSTAPVSTSGNDFLYSFSNNGYVTVRRTDETKAVRAGMTIGNEYEYNGFNFNIHGEPKGRLFGAAAGNPTQFRYSFATKQLYIKAKYLEGKRSVGVADKQLATREWQNAHRVMRARRFQLTKEDILQSFKASYGLAIK